jgi:PPOX class probable F420-dependent enzyme
MIELPQSVHDLLAKGPLGHLVTLNPDGSPQVSLVWFGISDGEFVMASLGARRKMDNVVRDPRVVITFESDVTNQMGLREYLVVHGTARLTEGGGPALLQELAYTYIGPGVTFPPMPDPPEGVIMHVAPERLGGIGPWAG